VKKATKQKTEFKNCVEENTIDLNGTVCFWRISVMSPVSATAGHQGPMSASDMDVARAEQTAYEYLCRLEESKKWIEMCIGEEMPRTTELEEALRSGHKSGSRQQLTDTCQSSSLVLSQSLLLFLLLSMAHFAFRNGVYLAKLSHFFAPNVVPARKIFDAEQSKYFASGLHFRHTDNINFFLQAIKYIGLPEVRSLERDSCFWALSNLKPSFQIFTPETTDIYDRKNMPRVIFCIHALSLFLYKLGIASEMDDLTGKATFTEEEIGAMREALDQYGLPMPQFRKIGGIMASEMPVDKAALHAAIIAVNEAVERGGDEDTARALRNPAACLANISQVRLSTRLVNYCREYTAANSYIYFLKF
jgi:hypothetical protein